MADGDPYQYIILHKSCRNHPGVLACQAAHAAGGSMLQEVGFHATWEWDPDRVHVVALEAETSDQLQELSINLSVAGIRHALILEPDPPYNGAATAVGVGPLTDRERLKPFLEKFKLLR